MAECAHCKMSLSEKARHKKIAGKTRYFCSSGCEALYEKNIGKKVDYKKVFERGL